MNFELEGSLRVTCFNYFWLRILIKVYIHKLCALKNNTLYLCNFIPRGCFHTMGDRNGLSPRILYTGIVHPGG